MISEARQAEVLGERLRDVGFSDRAVGLIIEQVQGLGRESSDYSDAPDNAGSSSQGPGLAEAATAYEVDRSTDSTASAEQARRAATGPISRRVGKPSNSSSQDVAAEVDGQLIAPDLPLFGTGIVAWILVLAGGWQGLSCSPSLLGVGEIEIVGNGCAGAGPGLFSFAGLVTALWLFAPAAWHPLRGFLRLPKLEIEPALRATAIWCGFAFLLVTTLILASLA
ncbi:MAG: hypothetical protein KDH19_13930 [Geminicoccaceae bacterium]|nr:hypothetical protein [Geminicoccaceae bacterium]